MQFKQAVLGLATVISLSVVSGSATHAAEASWTDKVKVSGDLRYRFENTDQEGREDRERSRLRTRLNIKADVNETIKFGARLATGGDNAISTNQSSLDAS